MKNKNYELNSSDIDNDQLFDLDELESKLEEELLSQFSDLELLEEDRKMIGNPDSLGQIVHDTVMSQINNQIASLGAEEFVSSNKGLAFDPRNSAHIQTTDSFSKGKIATHNSEIDYQERYDDWQNRLEKDGDGNIKMHNTRFGKKEANLAPGARAMFDKGRPVGSREKGIDMDHTISAGEIIRDPQANAHLSSDEQIAFANSSKNLHKMDSSHNRSKKDTPMKEWLDNPNSKGQKPIEIFDISKKQDNEYREKDRVARKEYKKVKTEGEQRSVKTGRRSQRNEVGRMATHAGKAIGAQFVFKLLKELLVEVTRSLIRWFKSAHRKIKTFLGAMKEAVKTFVTKLRNEIGRHLKDALRIGVTVIVSSVFRPIGRVIRRFGALLKQGFKSIQSAINYLRDPKNKNKPFSIKIAQVGKIVVAGLAAAGAIFGGQVIELGLNSIPVVGQILAFEIPLLGSLSSLIGLFISAMVSGILGAILLNWIDKFISKHLQDENLKEQINKGNEILATQTTLIAVGVEKLEDTKEKVSKSIIERHNEASEIIKESLANIEANVFIKGDNVESDNEDDFEDMFKKLNEL